MPGEELLTSALSSAASGAANSISGLVSGITGLIQKHKANKLLAQTKRPTYAIPNEILQNQKQAELNARQGLPSEQYQQGMQNIARQQNTALQRATDRRGGLLAVAGTQQVGTDAALNLDVANAKQRLQNQQALYGVNNQVAQYRDKAFQINQLQPYQQQYNYGMSLLGQGNQNLLGGIDKLVAGGLRAGTSATGSGTSSGGRSAYNPYLPTPISQENPYGTGGPTIF